MVNQKKTQGWVIEKRPGGVWVAIDPNGIRTRFDGVWVGHRLHGWDQQGVYWVLPHQAQVAVPSTCLQEVDSDTSTQSGVLCTQFPGKVRKIFVRPGDRVVPQTPLILLEAMKMEWTLKAPFLGLVQSIRVEEGQVVRLAQPYLDLEPLAQS